MERVHCPSADSTAILSLGSYCPAIQCSVTWLCPIREDRVSGAPKVNPCYSIVSRTQVNNPIISTDNYKKQYERAKITSSGLERNKNNNGTTNMTILFWGLHQFRNSRLGTSTKNS
jgi:hypothetical protein